MTATKTKYSPVASFFRANTFLIGLLLFSAPWFAQTGPPADPAPSPDHTQMHHDAPSTPEQPPSQMPHDMSHMDHGQMEGMKMGDSLNPCGIAAYE